MSEHEMLNQILAYAIYQAISTGIDPTKSAESAAIAFRSGLAAFSATPSSEGQFQASQAALPDTERLPPRF